MRRISAGKLLEKMWESLDMALRKQELELGRKELELKEENWGCQTTNKAKWWKHFFRR